MKWSAWLAWFVVLCICVLLPVLRAKQSAKTVEASSSAEVDVSTRMMGRYIVGVGHAFPSQASGLLSTLDNLPKTDETQRIATAIIAGEVAGRASAEARLKAIDTDAARSFLPIYAAKAQAIDLSAERDRFGWFADLAQSFGHPDDDALRARVLGEARQTLATVVVAGIVGVVAGGLGFALFVTAIVLIALRKIRFTFLQPTGLSNTYIEAFAIYLAGFILIGLAIGWAWPTAPLGLHIVGMIGPIVVAFYWPMLRGTLWKHQQRDWGIHTGRGLLLEALCGVAGYLAGLPIIAAGVIVTIILLRFSGATATHPIMQDLDMSPLFLLGVAAVFAPLTEELLFRGALVSHLRGWVGIATSAVISGLIFASVHPQGWAAIPALASIGCVLAVIRQWRGSLVPSIVAHALHNGTLLTVVILMLH